MDTDNDLFIPVPTLASFVRWIWFIWQEEEEEEQCGNQRYRGILENPSSSLPTPQVNYNPINEYLTRFNPPNLRKWNLELNFWK